MSHILEDDKWRHKLIESLQNKTVLDFCTAFPPQANVNFDYVASGSYAAVYRQQTLSSPEESYSLSQEQVNSANCRHNSQIMEEKDEDGLDSVENNDMDQPEPYIGSETGSSSSTHAKPPRVIIKLINVYSENMLFNLDGTSGRKMVTTYQNVYNEFQISSILAELVDGISELDPATGLYNFYRCPMFPQVYQSCIVQDDVPEYFGKGKKNETTNSYEGLRRIHYKALLKQIFSALNKRKKKHKSESAATLGLHSLPQSRELELIKPEIAAIVMEDCGIPLAEAMQNLSPLQIFSVCKQMLLGFLISQEAMEFEHRDLHPGNIMIQQLDGDERLIYHYREHQVSMFSCGVQVKVIDTTFSRIKYSKFMFMSVCFYEFHHSLTENRVFYRSLKHLFNLPKIRKARETKVYQSLDTQNQAYDSMAVMVHNKWHKYHKGTNIIWMMFIFKTLLKSDQMTKDEGGYRKLIKEIILWLFLHPSPENAKMWEFLNKKMINTFVPLTINTIPNRTCEL